MKRKLTLFLSAVMAASSLPMTAYAANFKDINDVPWSGASAVINSVADRGLLSGYDDGTFRARNNVTYCEAMQMVYTTLTKTGNASFDAVSVYSYMSVLDTYKVPKWAQMAVAYGLSEGILDMQMVVTKFAGGTKAATRDDVATIFGNAMGKVYGKEKDTSAAATFADYWTIPVTAVEQVNMLKKLGIVSGDEYNRFNPKKNINRAEMAVMLNKTYDVLAEGVSYSGEIVLLEANEATNGRTYYYIELETEAGRKENFNADENTVVYIGNTNDKSSMASLSEGDDVAVYITGDNITCIRLMKATNKQAQYDITGYLNSVKDGKISLENENTGETDRFDLESGTDYYVDGKKVLRKELEDIVKERYNEFAYVGLNVYTKREKVDVGGGQKEYESVTYVDEVYITFVKEYTVIGKVDQFSDQSISLSVSNSSSEKSYAYASDVKFYIADEETGYEALKKLANSGTVYAKVTVNDKDKVTAVALSEDTFAVDKEKEESKTYKVCDLTKDKLIIEEGSGKKTFNFGSSNPVENIQFYTWDAPDADWDSVSLKNAEAYVEADTYENDKGETKDVENIYCKLVYNNGGRLTEVYLSAVRNAWKNSAIHQTERQGTVASVKDDVLKFKTSTVPYTLLKSYKGNDLSILSGLVNSKTLLAKMANDDALELYAEIEANGDNEIVKLEARLTSAKGELVELNREEKTIKIKTGDGNEFELKSQKTPRLTDEIEDEFEIEDLEGKNSEYVGETVTLGFATGGIVNEITVGGGKKVTESEVKKVIGVATAADDGLKVKGDTTTYRWMGKTSDITVKNYSGPSESLDVVKAMIEDPDVEVYVIATLEESAKGDMVVDGIKVYVQSAEGTLRKFGDTVVIKTESGNTFAFDRHSALDFCDVDGFDQEALKEREKGIGTYVELTFEDDGEVCGIQGR